MKTFGMVNLLIMFLLEVLPQIDLICSYTFQLCRVERIVKTFGMVNANPETIKGSECITIINGFSNLMMEVLIRGRRIQRNQQNIPSRCLVPRRGWVLEVQSGLPPCLTIALLKWSASSRSRNNLLSVFPEYER